VTKVCVCVCEVVDDRKVKRGVGERRGWYVISIIGGTINPTDETSQKAKL